MKMKSTPANHPSSNGQSSGELAMQASPEICTPAATREPLRADFTMAIAHKGAWHEIDRIDTKTRSIDMAGFYQPEPNSKWEVEAAGRARLSDRRHQ
jgi:hypothetical protein